MKPIQISLHPCEELGPCENLKAKYQNLYCSDVQRQPHTELMSDTSTFCFSNDSKRRTQHEKSLKLIDHIGSNSQSRQKHSMLSTSKNSERKLIDRQSLNDMMKRNRSPLSRSPLMSARHSDKKIINFGIPAQLSNLKLHTKWQVDKQQRDQSFLENYRTTAEEPPEILVTDMDMLENKHQILTCNKNFQLRTPFQDFSQYNYPGGFGRKTSPEKNPHTLLLNRSLDRTIVRVAKQVQSKERKNKDGYSLRLEKNKINDESAQLKKVNAKIGELIVKEEKKCQVVQQQNLSLKEQLTQYKKKITYYHKVLTRLDQEAQEKDMHKSKVEDKIAKLQDDIKRDYDSLDSQDKLIKRLTQKFQEKDIELNDMRKMTMFASKLEQERINIVRGKERVLQSIVDEEKLTHRYGGRGSPLGRRVRQMVGRKL